MWNKSAVNCVYVKWKQHPTLPSPPQALWCRGCIRVCFLWRGQCLCAPTLPLYTVTLCLCALIMPCLEALINLCLCAPINDWTITRGACMHWARAIFPQGLSCRAVGQVCGCCCCCRCRWCVCEGVPVDRGMCWTILCIHSNALISF